MEDLKLRLLKEKNQLGEKIDKLGEFLGSERFNELDIHQRNLLRVQHSAMNAYWECLSARLSILP